MARWALQPHRLKRHSTGRSTAVRRCVRNLPCCGLPARDGDILVSDMYLDDPTIRNLLKKSGLNKKIGIIITSHGKSKGYIWKKLKDKFLLTQHIGDNPISDLQSAHNNKIPAILTNISAPDPIESWMIDNGMDYLGKFLREFRLSLKEKIGFERLRYIQTHLNAPILLLASILLPRYYPKAYNILFCSRDCNQWFELYLRVANHIKPPITSEYFYTSRISRSNPSPDYLKYARSRIKENSVVVDLCGSGWSLRRLLDRINLKECNAFFLHALDPIKHYEEIYKPSANLNITSIISGSSISNIEIEMANYASHGQTLDVTSIDGIEIPIFDARTYSNNISEAISIQRNTFLNMVKHIPDLSIQQVASFDNQSLKLVIDQLYKIVSKEMVLSEFFGSAHHTEDSHVMFDLSLQKRFVA